MEQELAEKREQMMENEQDERSYLFSLKWVPRLVVLASEQVFPVFLLSFEAKSRYLSILPAALAGQCCRI